MDTLLLGIFSALWLGIMTSISPCPLATNIAAISFVGRRVGNPRLVLVAGMLYTAGRTLAYVLLGSLTVSSLLSAPAISHFLQLHLNKFLGPLLILVGMFLLEMLRFGFSRALVGEGVQKRAETWGIWGAGLLGLLFALSFCPVSAALFFGSLIPLGIKHHSGLLIPAIYGIGTGLPVLFFAFLMAVGTKYVGAAFDRLTIIERWTRRITGVIFVVVGIYYSAVYIFGVQF